MAAHADSVEGIESLIILPSLYQRVEITVYCIGKGADLRKDLVVHDDRRVTTRL